MKMLPCHFRSFGKLLPNHFVGRGSATAALLLASLAALDGNPSGGTVAAGSASISGTGTGSVTIDQTSRTAVINWESFSINQGELTTFLQPSRGSAILNRVTGGSVSNLDGTLKANGQVFIINGNGLLIGSTGVVDTAGFAASTQNLQDKDFLAGKYHFSGTSDKGVENLGSIKAIGGDIYLIGHTVDNEGSLKASSGTVGLAAGNDVLIKQSGTEHVFVNPAPIPVKRTRGVAVNNSGTIAATNAELRAANGNMYALAINNGGTIRATTVKNVGGHIFLTSDKGVIVNTGALAASSSSGKATGGQITLKTAGTVVQHGQVVAHGGKGGTGGSVDLSGGNLDFTGGVDLTTIDGATGSLLLDPSSITVTAAGPGNGVITGTGTTTIYTPVPNFPKPTLYTAVLNAQLELANVIINGVNNVTIASTVAWNSPATLTLETSGSKGTININAPIRGLYDRDAYARFLAENPYATILPGTQATLAINDIGNGYVTTGPKGIIDVNNFTMENGFWRQIVSKTPVNSKTSPGYINFPLPAFTVTNDFQLQNTTTFERFAGGNGKAVSSSNPADGPYQIVDIFGLQGVGSPSDTLLSSSFVLNNNINETSGAVTYSTTYWNGGDSTSLTSGAGWVPIGEGGKTVQPFSGTFNGNGHYIAGYYLYRPGANLVGLFGDLSGTVENVRLDAVGNEGTGIGGILVGRLRGGGLVQRCDVSFDTEAFSGQPTEPTPSDGTTANQSNLISPLGVSAAAGGVVGEVLAGGNVVACNSSSGYELLGSGGLGTEGLIGFAGLVGVNYGTITNCTTSRSGDTSVSVAGIDGLTQSAIDNSISLGGLVGTNFGKINGGASYGDIGSVIDNVGDASILSGTGNFYIGGFVGSNYGTINGTVTVKVNGKNVTESYQSFTTDNVSTPERIVDTSLGTTSSGGGDVDGGTGSYYVGGFTGANYGTISNAYSAHDFNGVTDNLGNPLTPGGVVTGNGNLNGPTNGNTGALGDYAVGGFAGGNFGKITHSGTEDTVVGNGTIAGIGTVSTTKNGTTTTVPATVSISNSLSLDSYLVGGFVGLNGKGSSITGSFSSPVSKTIDFNLDPDSPATAEPASAGQKFSMGSEITNNDPLVSSNGIITGGAGFYIVGGFAGGNYGTISTSYSAGDVIATGTTTQSNSFYVGGLAGINLGNISNVYATGDVISYTTSSSNQTGIVGGLVAEVFGGSIQKTYSLGEVTGGTTRGGLIGVLKSGSVSGSFWNESANLTLDGYSAGGKGALGETEARMKIDKSDLDSSIYADANWNFTSTWKTGSTLQFPTLQGVP